MLRFIKHHLNNISDVAIYPIISFTIFFVFFIVVLIWVIKTDKAFIQKIKNIPFD